MSPTRSHLIPCRTSAGSGLCTLKLIPIKVPKRKSVAHSVSNQPAIEEKDLFCDERLDAKSPELWPEQVRGVTRFLSSLLPLGSGGIVDNSPCEWTSEFSAEEINMLYSFGNQSESAMLEQIREYHNLSYQLGLEEAHEMTRGNLLHIFDQNMHRQRT